MVELLAVGMGGNGSIVGAMVGILLGVKLGESDGINEGAELKLGLAEGTGDG